jgi:hypothetical protein
MGMQLSHMLGLPVGQCNWKEYQIKTHLCCIWHLSCDASCCQLKSSLRLEHVVLSRSALCVAGGSTAFLTSEPSSESWLVSMPSAWDDGFVSSVKHNISQKLCNSHTDSLHNTNLSLSDCKPKNCPLPSQILWTMNQNISINIVSGLRLDNRGSIPVFDIYLLSIRFHA